MIKLPFMNFLTKREYTDINKQIDNLQKNSLDNNFRSALDATRALGDTTFRIPYFPLPMRTLYDLSEYSDVLKTVIFNVNKEIFRNGFSIEEKFAVKCVDCDAEFDHALETCEECGSTKLRKPDVDQKKMLEKYTKKCNANGQDLIKVSRHTNRDAEVIDDMYLMQLYEFHWNPDGTLAYKIPEETLRSDPLYMRLIADKTGRPGYNDNGKIAKMCLMHRTDIWYDKEKCPICGKELFTAYFRSENPVGHYIFFTGFEIKHASKYSPSLIYGFSNIFAIWLKLVTLMNQDYYMEKYYSKQRPPRGLLFVNTSNTEGLEKAWMWMMDMFKRNPHMIPPIAIETQENKGKFVEFIDFMRSLDEMQFIEMRNEFRTQIGAIYGCMPLFQGDTSASGGLNNEGLQITVTNRAISDGQEIWNKEMYPWLCENFGITDYKIVLNPNEEKDEASEQDLFSKKINNARAMQQMGYEVTLNYENEFEFKPVETPVKDPQTKQMEQQMSMQQPMPGQEQPPVDMGNPIEEQTPLPEDMGDSDQNFQGQPEDVSMSKKSQELKKKRELLKDYLKTEEGKNFLKPSGNQSGKLLEKDKHYLSPGEKAPDGALTETGKNGGKYYTFGQDRYEEQDNPKKNRLHTENLKDKPNYGDCHRDSINWVKQNGGHVFTAGVPDKDGNVVGFHSVALKDRMVHDPILNVDESIEEYSNNTPYKFYAQSNLKNFEESLNKHPVKKEGGAVTSNTSGVNRPTYGKKEIQDDVLKYFTNVIKEEMKEAKVFNYNIEKAGEQIKTTSEIIATSLYAKKFAGVSKSISERIKEAVVKGLLTKRGLKETIEAVKKVGGVEDFQAENIVRTETASLRNTAREQAYKSMDPEGNFKFKWIGPDDHRTTDTCLAITKRTRNGVNIDELKEIIKDEVENAKKRGELPNDYDAREYSPHFQCRHTFSKVN
jgi:hypothetical protein